MSLIDLDHSGGAGFVIFIFFHGKSLSSFTLQQKQRVRDLRGSR